MAARKDDGPSLGTVYQLPTGRWRAQFSQDGQQVRRNFATEKLARQWLATAYADRERGTYVDPRGGRITVRDYAEGWRAALIHRPATAAAYEGIFRRHVYPYLGDRSLRSVMPSHVQSWVRWMRSERTVDFGKGPVVLPALADATVCVYHGIVAAMFIDAVQNKVLAHSPCAHTKLPEPDGGKVVPLSLEQVAAIHEAMPDHLAATVILAAGTGLRVGEVLGLTKDRVDFLRRKVTVDRQLKTVQGANVRYLGPAKTKASMREVPMPKVVADVLAAHMKVYPPAVVRMPVGGPSQPEAECAFLFTTKDGRSHVGRTTFALAFRAAADAVGVTDGFHALRHHYASLLIEAGVSIKVVQERLGHATAAETLDTYGHLFPSAEDKTRQAVDDAWSVMLDPGAEDSEEGTTNG